MVRSIGATRKIAAIDAATAAAPHAGRRLLCGRWMADAFSMMVQSSMAKSNSTAPAAVKIAAKAANS